MRMVAYQRGSGRVNFICMVFKNLSLKNTKEFLNAIMTFRRVRCLPFASGLFRKHVAENEIR